MPLDPSFQHGSPSAKALARWLREGIEYTRDGLERPMSPEMTERLRGRIEAYRALLDLVDPPPAEDPEDHMDAGNVYAEG